jgi:arabinogalactan oligomer / maltooligosaccharide transport system substrate-binding protein
MIRNRFGKVAAAVVVTGLISGIVTAPVHAASNTIIVWADETRGPNLQKVIAAKGDWVPGYTIKIVPFSSFDALKAAFDNATALTGPDIVVGANDWVATGAKQGKLAPVTLSSAVRANFTSNNFFDLSYKGVLYGVPLDVNNVAMIYNAKLTGKPTTLGGMVKFYLANKAADKLTAGLCVAGGGMSWGAASVLGALGGAPYVMSANGSVSASADPVPSDVVGANIKALFLDKNGKSNGFFPATDTGCKTAFLAGTVPYAIIGNWEWQDYVKAGFDMNLMPVPGVKHGSNGSAFASVSGAMLTTFAAAHGVDQGAKSLLNNFFGSTAGAVAYQNIELRPPANKKAQKDASITAAQKGFGKAGSLAGIPQIGAILNGAPGGKSYWDLLPAFWTDVLVNGKDPVASAAKMDTFFQANIAAGIPQL